MERLTGWVLRHRALVIAAWALLAVAGFASLQPVSDALSSEFRLPGSESTDTAVQIEAIYGNGGPRVEVPIAMVATLPEGTTVDTPGVREEVGQAFGTTASAVENGRFADYASTGDRTFVSDDGRTTYGVVWYPAGDTAFDPAGESLDAATAAAEDLTVRGAPVLITGIDALSSSNSEESGGPDVLIEVLIGGLFALVVLAWVFGSLTAMLPLLMAAISIPVTFLTIWPIAEASEVSIVVQFLVALIGLGVSIDYSLLVVMRWREERAGGRDNREAVTYAMSRAGRSVLFSGVAVAVGLLALLAIPVPFLRSIAYGGLLIPLVATAIALTLLPVLLDIMGPRLDRMGIKRRVRQTGEAWVPWARTVVRYRWVMGGIAVAILAVLFIPALSLNTGTPDAAALASSGQARQGLDQLEESGIGAGVLSPYEALVTGGDPADTAESLSAVEGVRGAVDPGGSSWQREGTAVVNVFPTEQNSSATVERVRDDAATLPGEVTISGANASNVDFNDAVYGNFPVMLALIIAITFVLLVRAFRSLLLAAKAVVFNILSIGAVWGFIVLFWQEGGGSEAIFGIEATGAIDVWIPLMVFAFLYGLSMDYEVFIISRMRERYDQVGNTNEAVVAGVARTGRLVTAGSLILFGAFVALASGPETQVKVFATALAVGILLDATVVRGLLVPAFVSVAGRWNWWLPAWAARLVRVKPSPLLPRGSEKAPEPRREGERTASESA